MQAYLEILEEIYYHGGAKGDRTGTGTVSVFGTSFRHDLRNGFPLLTTKKINPLKPLAEMFAFFKGVTNLAGFHELDCGIWDAWALKKDFTRVRPKEISEIIQSIADAQGIDVAAAEKLYTEKIHLITKFSDEVRDASAPIEEDYAGIGEEDNAERIIHERINKRLQAIHHKYEKLDVPSSWVAWLTSLGVQTHATDVLVAKGELGPIYGAQWLGWKMPDGTKFNQLDWVVNEIEFNPYSRRHILLGWNPSDINYDNDKVGVDGTPIKTSSDAIQNNVRKGKMSLPPCHLMTIFNVTDSPDGKVLNLHQIMRSSDVPIGLPFNIAGYAFMLEMIADRTGLIAGELLITSTDAHIYNDQMELVPEQLKRVPGTLPKFTMPHGIDILDPSTLTLENAKRMVDNLTGYEPQPHIKYPVAV